MRRKRDFGRRCLSCSSSGSSNGNWSGGRTRHHKGYVLVWTPSHPRAHNGYVFEHVLVAESKIGRFLLDDEVAHHDNEIKDDNRPENIIVMKRDEHSKHHARKS